MATWKTMLVLLAFTVILTSRDVTGDPKWPYQRQTSRPKNNPYCQAGVIPFCPTGQESNTMPTLDPSDTVYVYAMKAPVWEFKFGDLLGKFHIMHDAMGFHHVQSGANFTMEWYELDQLFNCTFPHELKNDTLVWCNQGATCIYNGIDEKHWTQNGTLVKVAEITGEIFNKFANWTEWDNNTGVYYEPWTVLQKPDDVDTWFDAWECASWVQRAYIILTQYGAKFNQSVHLNYTRMNIYSEEPFLLGNASTVVGPNAKDKKLKEDILKFYRKFQSHQSMPKLLLSLIEAFGEIVLEKKFYLYYNELYWKLHVRKPYFHITYKEVPLPTF